MKRVFEGPVNRQHAEYCCKILKVDYAIDVSPRICGDIVVTTHVSHQIRASTQKQKTLHCGAVN